MRQLVIQGGQAKHGRRLVWAVTWGWVSLFMKHPVLPISQTRNLPRKYRLSVEGESGQDWADREDPLRGVIWAWAESSDWPSLVSHHVQSWRALKMCFTAASLLDSQWGDRPAWGAVPIWWKFAGCFDCCIGGWGYLTGMVWICVWVEDHHHSSAIRVRETSALGGTTVCLNRCPGRQCASQGRHHRDF